MNDRLWRSVGRALLDTVRTGVREWRAAHPSADRGRSAAPASDRGPSRGPRVDRTASGYPGDYSGMPRVSYRPVRGERPDPGEVVWTWVPFEEDHSRGKDRPVLLVGHDGPWLLGLQLTSADHDRDAAQEAAAGRHWVDIGTGDWDERRRPSEVRVNRVIRVDPDAVRRVSVSLSRQSFDEVVAGMRQHLA